MKNELKSWEEAWANLYNDYELPRNASDKKYLYGYVFDENKSVKWNNEQVDKHNAALVERSSELQRKRDTAITEATNEIVKLIVYEFDDKINEGQARVIYDFAFECFKAVGFGELRSFVEEYVRQFKAFIAKGDQQ